MKTYKFYADPGHGWIAVKMKELMQLGIITKISRYSYMHGATAYLEEDVDLAEFFNAYREKYGQDPKYVHNHTNGRSIIRSYDSFNVNKAIDIALNQMKGKEIAEV